MGPFVGQGAVEAFTDLPAGSRMVGGGVDLGDAQALQLGFKRSTARHTLLASRRNPYPVVT
jgi:hypothetical protein